MKYMLLLFADEAWATDPNYDPTEDGVRHQEFATWCGANGIDIVEGTALRSSSSATTLRRDGDELVVTDGPVAELREALGGFYVIDVAEQELAIEAARRVPSGDHVEVRPIWDLEETAGEG